MTDFWLYGALLILAGMLFVLWPVWKMRRQNTVDRTALNVALYEERVAELAAQKAAGEITTQLHDIALEESGQLLREDTSRAEQERHPTLSCSHWPNAPVSAHMLLVVIV